MTRDFRFKRPRRRRSDWYREEYLSTQAQLQSGITHSPSGQRRYKVRKRHLRR